MPIFDNNAVIYLSTDQISSTSLTTDANGAEISQVRYDPYGAVRWSSGTLPTDKTFTGQRSESFGLLDYKARYYSPDLGHFIQADTLIPGPGNPLAWDRYAYVQNNPLIYVDPSGNRPCTDDPEFSDCENGLPHVPRKSNYDPVKIDTNFPTDDIHSLYIAYKYTRGWWNDFGYGSPYFSEVDFLELMLSYEFSTLPRINDFPIQYPGQLENLAHATAHWFFFKV